MAAKMKLNGLNSVHHTAGIFSDMTVDGPEIGTLVLIVDRAKNLPNRKTIGKQDPYCAARLGKEAKKTETDRRGGQTPRWDQELRYTVHDSPDYYQLKVSVFNDDKKTDLIGETWVDLKEVVVPGGGQNDIWHNLSCKGKYAGEIRLEITYYDTRPQEKAEKLKQAQAAMNAAEEGSRESLRGPRQQKSPVKRRPLPTDPVSGSPAAPPVAIPEHAQTPPRAYPPSPMDHGSISTRGHREPMPIPDHIQTQTPPRGYHSPVAPPDLPTPPRGYQTNAGPEHTQTPPRGYQNVQPSAIPEHVHTPNRNYQSPSYIPNQSPLQSVEYNTPPSNRSHSRSQGYENRSPNGYGPPQEVSPAQHIENDRHEMYDPMARTEFTPGRDSHSYRGRGDSFEEQPRYGGRYDAAHSDEYGSPPSPGGPPPPPPAHRSRHGSTQVSPGSAMVPHGSYGFPPESRSPNSYGTPTHDPVRHIPPYSQSRSYANYSPEREQEHFHRTRNGGYEDSPLRHHSYDSAYSHSHGSMQPTVEDAPPSPGGGNFAQLRHPRSRNSSYDERRYEQVPSPAPLNLTNRGNSATSSRNTIASVPAPANQYSNSSNSLGYTSATSSQISSYRERSRDRSHTDASMSSRTSYNSVQQQAQRPRGLSEDPSAAYSTYGILPVPATLVAGIDPLIAQDLADRIYDEKRANANNTARGRSHYQNQNQNQDQNQDQDQSMYEHNGRKLLAYHESASDPFVPAAASYDDRQSRYSNSTVAVVKPRGVSPSVRIPRKSVSPAPPPSDDQRRLSGVPFGPDSYNALNPTLSSSQSTPSLSAAYDHKKSDPDAKIITYDGREVDPSDHIPESNYAPLLESKAQKNSPSSYDRYRSSPNAQPMSATGRRPLQKTTARPQSISSMSPSYMSGGGPDSTLPGSGRNRLQKKTNRTSNQLPQNPSPLAPITPYQDNNYSPRPLTRGNTTDYNSSENYAPAYGSSPNYRGSAGPPPIPAKVPNGPPPPGDPWALLEEMKNIDLGTGRARRRGY